MAKLQKEYDVIVVGGGINGLACAAYLQKSGLRCAVFERLSECGTQCCSEELLHPGVRVNLCANWMVNLHSPAYDELEMERFGLEMLPSSEWALFYPTRRDKSGVLCHSWDARGTYQAWQRINKHDAEVFRKISSYIAPRLAGWLDASIFKPPSAEAGMKVIQDLKGCPDLPSNLATMTTEQLADELFQDDRIKSHYYAMNLLCDFDPLQPGFAAGSLIMGPFTTHMIYQSAIARGGPHALTHALCRCFVHYGGSIFTNCPVTKIIVENGEAKGVVLSNYAVYPEAEVRATKAVISDLTAVPTFKDLIGLDKLSKQAGDAIKSYTYDGMILFTNFYGLKEPLDWSGAGYPKELDRAYGFNFGLDKGIEDVKRGRADWKAHRLPDPPIVCGLSVQSYCFADPTQAPPGEHTLMTWACVTYDLNDYPAGAMAWDDIREEYGDKVEDLLAEYVPNIKTAKIDRYCETPLGYYRRNPSQIKGRPNITKVPSQHGLNAPFPGCGAPRTPISKLYFIRYWGTSTTLDAGYRAAEAVAKDLGIRDKQDWWKVKIFEPLMSWYKRHNIQSRWTVD